MKTLSPKATKKSLSNQLSADLMALRKVRVPASIELSSAVLKFTLNGQEDKIRPWAATQLADADRAISKIKTGMQAVSKTQKKMRKLILASPSAIDNKKLNSSQNWKVLEAEIKKRFSNDVEKYAIAKKKLSSLGNLTRLEVQTKALSSIDELEINSENYLFNAMRQKAGATGLVDLVKLSNIKKTSKKSDAKSTKQLGSSISVVAKHTKKLEQLVRNTVKKPHELTYKNIQALKKMVAQEVKVVFSSVQATLFDPKSFAQGILSVEVVDCLSRLRFLETALSWLSVVALLGSESVLFQEATRAASKSKLSASRSASKLRTIKWLLESGDETNGVSSKVVGKVLSLTNRQLGKNKVLSYLKLVDSQGREITVISPYIRLDTQGLAPGMFASFTGDWRLSGDDLKRVKVSRALFLRRSSYARDADTNWDAWLRHRLRTAHIETPHAILSQVGFSISTMTGFERFRRYVHQYWFDKE